jgi:cell division protein FtsA
VASILGAEQRVFVGIDVGTKKVCTLVAHPDEQDELRILGVGVAPTRGMRKGGVVDLNGLLRSVTAAKDQAERTSGLEIASALVNLSGTHVSSMNSKGMAGVSGRTIARDDVRRALEAAQSVALPYNREVVHVIPRGFVVDGQDGIKDALGMHGYRLEVDAHLVTAGSTALRNIEKCIQAAAVTVDGWVLNSLAAGELLLTETEREMGVVICDVGGGTTDLAIYIEGSVWHSAMIPVGGEHVTNDIAQGLHLPQEAAEAIKRRHGHAMTDAVDPAQTLAVHPFGEERPTQVRRVDLASIIEARVEELFSLIRQEIKRSGYDELLPAGMVLTGGTSGLPGIRSVAGSVLRMPVRLAEPENLRGLVDKLRGPAFSTSVGLLSWAMMQEHAAGYDHYPRNEGWPALNLRGAAAFLRRLLPG